MKTSGASSWPQSSIDTEDMATKRVLLAIIAGIALVAGGGVVAAKPAKDQRLVEKGKFGTVAFNKKGAFGQTKFTGGATKPKKK